MVLFVIACVCCTLITAAATTATTAMVTAIKATNESTAASSSRNDWMQNKITGFKYLKYETFDDCQWWIRGNGDDDITATTGNRTLTKLTTTKTGNADDEKVALVCNLRTTNNRENKSNFSVKLPFIKKRTKSLKIECSDDEQLVSRGSLDENSFSHLSQLRELVIDNCKMARWPTATLANLRQLRNLTIRTRNIDWKDISLQVSADIQVCAYIVRTRCYSYKN